MNEFALGIRSIGLRLYPLPNSSNSPRLALLKLYRRFVHLFLFKCDFLKILTLHRLGEMTFLMVLPFFFFFPLVFRLLLRDADEVGLLHGPRKNDPVKSQCTFFNS